ncbi:T-cell receptor gamma chain C region 1, partial [Cariama cristata]
NTVIHWYQQKANKAPERILYFSQSKTVDEGFQAHRYIVERLSSQKVCILAINNVIPDDAATYYCAYWQTLVYSGYYKVFGTGTKLIVSDKGNSPPANSEILQKEHGDQITYVCLIEKFYPEVIRVTWTDGENKEVTNDVAKGDPWKSTEGDEYSIGSWLTVPAQNKDKNYYCKYEHESKEGSLQTQEKPNWGIEILFPLDSKETTAPQGEDCITYPGNSTVFNTDHLLHRTAYLVYIVLLLKSSMYYLIVLFFIYR